METNKNHAEVNYFSKSLEQYREIRKKEKEKPKLLFHVCCAACSCYPLVFLLDLFDITVFFSNSNIYPKEEYDKRKENLIFYINYLNNKFNKDIKFVEDTYDYESFKQDLIPYKDQKEGMDRCKICITKRLTSLCEYATKNNFKYVSTVMSISRNKNVYFINKKGLELQQNFKNLEFITFDFKKNNGQDIGVEISKYLGIYRQDYCGCEFSLR